MAQNDELFALYDRLEDAEPGKEAREIHIELKKYGKGLTLTQRYPLLPYVPSLVISMAAIIISLVQLLR